VTDHQYIDDVVATTLAPQESFGALVGTNPNGTWTLAISDSVAQDIGMLTEWSLEIVSTNVAPTISASTQEQATAVALNDNALTTSTLAVPASDSGSQICGLTVTTDITHTYSADLDITLTSPAGTIVTLTTDNGGVSDDVFAGTIWSDKAGELVTQTLFVDGVAAEALVPEEGLAAFNGEAYAGTWTLTVSDDEEGDLGTLNDWSISIDRCMRVED
jgi:subtilisin-like proprotein convertase family protein